MLTPSDLSVRIYLPRQGGETDTGVSPRPPPPRPTRHWLSHEIAFGTLFIFDG